MNVLFVHNNFPAQFRHVVSAMLASEGEFNVAAICASTAVPPSGIIVERYDAPTHSAAHAFARRFDAECQRAEQVLYAAMRLKCGGFIPDVILAHSGWGETIPLREAFPLSKIVVYCEYFYRAEGQDLGFDPEFPAYGLDGRVALSVKNAAQLMAISDADVCISPTKWQKSTYPRMCQGKIEVIHEGIDTVRIARAGKSWFRCRGGVTVSSADEVITYVARNLEPLRGIHTFIRAIPRLLELRPNANIVIVGGDGVSYGPRVDPPFNSWRAKFWSELSKDVDTHRVQFEGQLPYDRYIELLKISTAHVYLTYPFVLSWSLIEAMSAGCAIVASDTAPVIDVIPADAARFVSFFNFEDVANTAAQILADANERGRLQCAARTAAVETFDMASKCRPRLLKLIRSL